MKSSRKWVLTAVTVALVLLLAGCAAGSNVAANSAGADGHVANFWFGVWHGLISPITCLISFLNDKVSFYDVHNNGNFYDWGFFVGLGFHFWWWFGAGVGVGKSL